MDVFAMIVFKIQFVTCPVVVNPVSVDPHNCPFYDSSYFNTIYSNHQFDEKRLMLECVRKQINTKCAV